MDQNRHIIPHSFTISRDNREGLHGHKSCILWFTGLSGSGKSTIANAVEVLLYSRDVSTYILDGDSLRGGLNKGLGFSPSDRKENIRRADEAAKLLMDSGVIVLATFISPYRLDRDVIRADVKSDDFIKVYVHCSLQMCEKRDPKGLYKKAKAGEIPEFTGISAPYEPPANPEIIINTEEHSVEQCALQILDFLKKHQYVKGLKGEAEY